MTFLEMDRRYQKLMVLAGSVLLGLVLMFLLLKIIETRVIRDLRDPRGHLRLELEAVEILVDLHEDILAKVLPVLGI